MERVKTKNREEETQGSSRWSEGWVRLVRSIPDSFNRQKPQVRDLLPQRNTGGRQISSLCIPASWDIGGVQRSAWYPYSR